MIAIGLTNGTIYIPILWDIWVSPKVAKKRHYKTKPDILLNLLKRFLILKIPVKTIMFDSFFTSKEIMKWLIGDIKFNLQDEVYGISSSADTFEQKLAS